MPEEKNEAGTMIIPETETFTCPNCGGNLAFDIKSQKFMCRSCKSQLDINTMASTVKEYDFSDYQRRENNTKAYRGPDSISCKNCGSDVIFSQYQFASVCPRCSTTQIIPEKQEACIPPEGVVTFKVDKQDAQQRFRIWAKKRWFAPNDFKKSFGEGNLKGMYLPFWTYDANAVSYYNGLGGRNRIIKDRDGKTRMTTDWYPVSGVVRSTFDDVLVCASDKESLVNRVLPYRTTTQSVPYATEYMSGYYAEIYKLKADTCFEEAKRIMEDHMRSLAHAQIMLRYDAAQVTSISTKHTAVKYKHMLLPLWSSVFGYKGKTYGYIINGETGKVSGNRPYSVPKITAAAIAGIIVFILVFMAISGNEVYYNYNEERNAVYLVYDDYEVTQYYC